MTRRNGWAEIVVGVVMGVLFSAAIVLAGSLEPSVGPTQAGSQMVTLDQVYNFINNGTAATKMSAFTEPGSGPTAGTMHTLDEIYNLAGLRAPVPKTGQTPVFPIFLPPAGSDGLLYRGVGWPVPRFTDNNNGTVTDNLTGLIWLKNANCTDTLGGINKSSGTLNWADALTWSNNLATGHCGLTDGSTAGQWRLPNVREMQSLVDYGFSKPALCNTVGSGKWTEGASFIGVLASFYWSSTTYAGGTPSAWVVDLEAGNVTFYNKSSTGFLWPVRGGQ
jgi:hypothetical protein